MMGSFGGPGGRLYAFLTFLCFRSSDKERMTMSARKMVGSLCKERKNNSMMLMA